MVELREESDGRYARGYGGDVLNTAVYLSRLLGPAATVRFVTVLGDDPFSDAMVASWRDEGVVCDAVGRKRDAVPGLYLVQTDASGERRFLYWRSAAPARELFRPDWRACLDTAAESAWFYLSGITLAVIGDDGRKALAAYLAEAKLRGAVIAFDGNHRPALWPDTATARAAFEQMWRLSDVALPGVEDEQRVFGDADAQAVAARLAGYGIQEIAVKQGTAPVVLSTGGDITELPVPDIRRAVDTTAAGDSFNAAYLAQRLRGGSPDQAVAAGMTLAAHVVQHRGAIIPRDRMPDGASKP